MKPAALIASALALSAAIACKNNNSTTTTPSSTKTTESFSGTVNVGGSDPHNFTVGKTGEVDVTLTSAGPPATIIMGVAIGVPSGSTCNHLQGGSTNTAAGSSVQLAGVLSPGTLCVDVYDVGNQTEAVTYSVTVVHP